ncbi:MAG: ligase-associated DNA damage response exonuclease [Pseudomonadales bacterium]|jgi:putative mRNA 3-end processing factor|nr:ligase-associated DNA damage response exonuclease [Pseudomonadales bacterium]
MSASGDLLHLDENGLYCPAGDFHVDPWRRVRRAVITHGHGDHARPGMGHYWTQKAGLPILRKRLGMYVPADGVEYGEVLEFGPVKVSLHSAGHILGSAQVRIEHAGEVWVVSGDFKRDDDPTCAAFEVVPCDVFVTEATFAYPVYRWPSAREVAGEIFAWWEECRAAGRPAVLFSYALGKAQRILAELMHYTDRTVLLHGAMTPLVEIYRDAGVAMLPTRPVSDFSRKHTFDGELILAPPSASGSKWMRRFKQASTGFASGWMQIRGNRRRRGYDRGFVLSDHADWPSLIRTIEDCGARRVLATHGSTDVLVQHLRERGVQAEPLATPYGDEAQEEAGAEGEEA